MQTPHLSARFQVFTSTHREFQAPVHSHQEGQLVMPISGSMLCEIDNEIWMVPLGSAIWIPPHTPHRNRPVSAASFCFMFVDASQLTLPSESCSLAISPLIREMILHLTQFNEQAEIETDLNLSQNQMIYALLFNMLASRPREKLNFSLTQDNKLRQIAKLLLETPSDRRKVKDWADFLAMSERTFSRLVLKETGMTFGAWRRQLHIVISLRLLTEGKSVQIVSEQLGYDSVSAFITMFKKALKKSPKRYIKHNLSDV